MKSDNKTLKTRAASLERLHNLLPHRAEPLFELIQVYTALEDPDMITATEAMLDVWRMEYGTKSDEWTDLAILWDMTHWGPLVGLSVEFELMGHADIADEFYHLAQLAGIPAEDLNLQMADRLESHGQLKRALVYWRKTLELNSENKSALFSLAQFYRWEGNPSGAVEFLERLHRLVDDPPEDHEKIGAILADTYLQAGRLDDAERLLRSLRLDQELADDFAADIGILRNIAEGRGDEPVGEA